VGRWQDRHLHLFREHYARAPYFRVALELLEEALSHRDRTISELNVRIVRRVCSLLGITTSLAMSQEFRVTGTKTGRLIALLERVGATTYLSGPAARTYLEEDRFRESGIRLEYKTYDNPSYPQLWGGFVGEVSVLDLLANTGERAREYLKSRTPNEVAIG